MWTKFSSLKLFTLENNSVDKCCFFQDAEFALAFRSCFSLDKEPGNSHREALSLSSFDRNKNWAFVFEWWSYRFSSIKNPSEAESLFLWQELVFKLECKSHLVERCISEVILNFFGWGQWDSCLYGTDLLCVWGLNYQKLIISPCLVSRIKWCKAGNKVAEKTSLRSCILSPTKATRIGK